jgi:hypothetical protein
MKYNKRGSFVREPIDVLTKNQTRGHVGRSKTQSSTGYRSIETTWWRRGLVATTIN